MSDVDRLHITSDVGRWTITPEWVFRSGVSDRAVRLYGQLGLIADFHTLEASPSRAELAELMRCGTTSVDRARDELVGIGALQIRQRFRANKQLPNKYQLVRVQPVPAEGEGVPTGGETPTQQAGTEDPGSPTDNPPTPRDAFGTIDDAGDGPARTAPSTPWSHDELDAIDHPEGINPEYGRERLKGIKHSIRPPREDAPT